MRVLFVASECYPLIKTGGLADVVGALPVALDRVDVDARVLLPAYPEVLERAGKTDVVAKLPKLFGSNGRLLATALDDGTGIFLLDAPHLFDRPGNPYLGPDGKDWPDNHLRFAALSWVAAEIGLGKAGSLGKTGDLGWHPDLIHAHDWQAGLVPAYLYYAEASLPVVMTIHNLAFQGVFPATTLKALRLPQASFTMDGLEYFGQVSFLKAGLVYADLLTTVSPTYAREITTPAAGMGMDGVLRARRRDLIGIVNGIDETVWNPDGDPALPAPYTARRLRSKILNKEALQDRFGLAPELHAPLFCVVSRLTEQKGLDLLLEVLPALIERGGQLVMLASGDAALETAFVQAARDHPGRVGIVLGYDEPLSHLMQAGSDAIIIPSRFEPCGLTQLYGLRYGTLPIVARVGGLADTVIDANEAALADGVATGFQFAPVTAEALAMALDRAFDLYDQPKAWMAVQKRAMGRKVGWSEPARTYHRLYRRLLDPIGSFLESA